MNKMLMNMGRSLLVNIFIIWLLCWMLVKIKTPTFETVFLGTLGTGIITFLHGPYTMHIWFPTHDLMAHFVDALVSWGIAGLWLGWWIRRK